MQRPEQHTLLRIWAFLGFIWHQNDIFVLFSIFFLISCWLFLAAIAYRTDDFSELLVSPTSLSWIATATSEVSIVRHGLDYFSLDVLLPFIHIQWRSSDVTFCPLAFVVSFWSALLLPSDKNELSIMWKLGDFVKSCLKEHPVVFCSYTASHNRESDSWLDCRHRFNGNKYLRRCLEAWKYGHNSQAIWSLCSPRAQL